MADHTVQATPASLQRWILHALSDGPLKRSELLRIVGESAQKEGFSAERDTTLKTALSRLEHLGFIVHIQHGWWGLPGWNAEYVKRSHAV